MKLPCTRWYVCSPCLAGATSHLKTAPLSYETPLHTLICPLSLLGRRHQPLKHGRLWSLKSPCTHTAPCFSLLAWHVPPANQTWAPLKLKTPLHTLNPVFLSLLGRCHQPLGHGRLWSSKLPCTHTAPCFSLLAWQAPPATQTWAPLRF